jgi:hypothetical protein
MSERPPSSWSNYLNAGVTVTLALVGFIVWETQKASSGDATQQSVQVLSGRITDLQKTVTDGQATLQNQISNLPLQGQELIQHQRQLDSLEPRVSMLEGTVIKLRSDFDNAIRTSAQPLMPNRVR